MNTKALEKFAQAARRQLHEQVGARLARVLTTDSAELRAKAVVVKELREQIKASSKEAVVEKVAYTWFNRFCALRYMDVNHYTRLGTVSPAISPSGETYTQPEILQEAKQGHIDERFGKYVDVQTVFGLLQGRSPSGDPQQEAYRLLLVGVCNYYHDIMPFMFEKIDDYTELLMPDDLLSSGSILQAVRDTLTEENCQNVEVIGWLYQFYISEKKDVVIKAKKAITAENIPAATQLFTPHWIVRFLVENSLGRLWLLNRPHSRLAERMNYYIKPEDDDEKPGFSEKPGFLKVETPEELTVCDPAVGSGHMLTYAFDLLYAIYEEEGYNPVDIPRLILRKNLYGMEIDERAGALAAFALVMKAREKDRRFFQREQEAGGIQPNIMVLRKITFTEEELDKEVARLAPLLAGEWENGPRQGRLFVEEKQLSLSGTEGMQALREALRHDLNLFREADNVGSLLRPQLNWKQITTLETLIAGTLNKGQLNWIEEERQNKAQRALRHCIYLARNYHVVVANPPYMGSRNMNSQVKKFLGNNFKDFKSDLFAAFTVRIMEMTKRGSFLGMMTPFNWMFLSSFEKLRRRIFKKSTITNLIRPEFHAFFDSAYVSVCGFTLYTRPLPGYDGAFIDLNDFYGAELQPTKALEAINNHDCGWFFRASATDFKKIPGFPIAYWVSQQMFNIFGESDKLVTFAPMQPGLQTSNNERFLRYWHEVGINNIGFGFGSNEEAKHSGKRWFPYNKGGQFRKWYGNNEYVVNWYNDGKEIKDYVDNKYPYLKGNTDYVIKDRGRYFREAVTWTKISSSYFGVRKSDQGFLFDVAGSSAFPSHEDIHWITALLCTKQALEFIKALNPTMNIQVGNVEDIPVPAEQVPRFRSTGTQLSKNAIKYARGDWDSYEISWNFANLLLVNSEFHKKLLASAYLKLRNHWTDTIREMQNLDEKNNRFFIDAYGLQNDLTSSVPLEEITLTCNPHYRYGSSSLKKRNWETLCRQFSDTVDQLATLSNEMAPDMPEEERLGLEQRLLDDTMREFVSYAVGCMFGRYSLDKPGLILANQGETVEDYMRKVAEGQGAREQGASGQVARGKGQEAITNYELRIMFPPDKDNALPILDGDWFPDDITERFKKFLRLTFGQEHYEENLAFIEAAIGRDIRSYFLRDFYDDHVKMYKKRPIYWLFSSPKGSFNCLIYMHRYRPDTVSVILNDYLREFRAKLQARKNHLQQVEVSPGATQRDKTQALKEIEQIDKTLHELKTYEDDILYPLATRQLQIDLDDGVLVNYNKFGNALKKVSGLSQ